MLTEWSRARIRVKWERHSPQVWNLRGPKTLSNQRKKYYLTGLKIYEIHLISSVLMQSIKKSKWMPKNSRWTKYINLLNKNRIEVPDFPLASGSALHSTFIDPISQVSGPGNCVVMRNSSLLVLMGVKGERIWFEHNELEVFAGHPGGPIWELRVRWEGWAGHPYFTYLAHDRCVSNTCGLNHWSSEFASWFRNSLIQSFSLLS